MARANTHRGPKETATHLHGLRIDYIAIEKSRLEDILEIGRLKALARRIQRTPGKAGIDHFPVFCNTHSHP